jgi:hypothetical protein
VSSAYSIDSLIGFGHWMASEEILFLASLYWLAGYTFTSLDAEGNVCIRITGFNANCN